MAKSAHISVRSADKITDKQQALTSQPSAPSITPGSTASKKRARQSLEQFVMTEDGRLGSTVQCWSPAMPM